MLVAVRPAGATDVPFLVEFYDRAYRGGYSACFGKYGPIGPQDFWWVQSEKSVYLVEVNHQPAGMVILGMTSRRLLVEELLGEGLGMLRRSESLPGTDDAWLRRIYEFLVDQFHRARQDSMTIRTSETNALGLAVVRLFEFTFMNALIVGTVPAGPRPGAAPDGYVIRRAAREDEPELERLYQDCFPAPHSASDLGLTLQRPHTRAFVAERDHYRVGLALVEMKDRVGQWVVGVRSAHRRKGVGTALASTALQFVHAKKLVALTTYWVLDSAAAQFARSQGCVTERAYLYFAKRL